MVAKASSVTSAALRIDTIEGNDFHVYSVELAKLLGISDAEITRLVRSAVLLRVTDPTNSRAYVYPIFENVRRYTKYRQNKKEQIHQEFLKAKAGRERATQLKVEMANRVASGELIDKQKSYWSTGANHGDLPYCVALTWRAVGTATRGGQRTQREGDGDSNGRY